MVNLFYNYKKTIDLILVINDYKIISSTTRIQRLLNLENRRFVNLCNPYT